MSEIKKVYDEETRTLTSTQALTVVDDKTGEVKKINFEQSKYYGPNFFKLYKLEFLKVLADFNIPVINVLIYICDNITYATNCFYGNQRSIAEDTGIGITTVKTAMRIMQSDNFLRRIKNGQYMVNPDILFKGDSRKQMMLRKIYNDELDCSDITKSKRRIKTRILDEAKAKRELNQTQDEEDTIIDPVLEALTEEEVRELYGDDIFTDWEHEW